MLRTYVERLSESLTPKKIVALVCVFLFGIVTTLLFPALRYTDVIEPRVSDVSPDVLAPLIMANPDDYLFIDVRSPDMYGKLHAEGSMNIPIHLFYDKRKEFPKEGKTIVLICSGGRLSGVAYSYLQHYGFRNIVRIEGGIENWQAQGYPTVLGELLE